jgi:hypothetical protein
MRFERAGLSLAVTLALVVAPLALPAQIIVRDPCFYMRDDCGRRDDIARLARDRALDRAAQAQERAQRLADARLDRELEMHVRAQLRADAMADARDQRTRALQQSARARDLAMHMRQMDQEDRLRVRELDPMSVREPVVRPPSTERWIRLAPGVRRRWQ